MSQPKRSIGPPQHAWTLYTLGFCIGLLGIQPTFLTLPYGDDPLGTFAALGHAKSVASWAIVPATLLLLLFGDRRLAGRSLFTIAIFFLLGLCSVVLVGHAAIVDTAYSLPAIAVLTLFLSKPVLAQLFNPLISTNSKFQPHRLYLFLMTSVFTMLGALASPIMLGLLITIGSGLSIPFIVVAMMLVVGIATSWRKTAQTATHRSLETRPTEFFLQIGKRKEIWGPFATLFLINLCVGIDQKSLLREDPKVAMTFLLIAAIAEISILVFIAHRVKKGLVTVGKLARLMAMIVFVLSFLHLFATAADFAGIQFLLQLTLGLCSGVVILSALVQTGDHAAEAEQSSGQGDVAKYFLLAFIAAVAGTKIDDLFQASFTASGMPIGMMNATLTVLSAALIYFLTVKKHH